MPRWTLTADRRTRPICFRPRLEALERRDAPAVLTVTNLSDHDPGSLRDQLRQAQNGDMIVFDPSLSGTIQLSTTQLEVATSVTIQGPGADVIAVSGNHRLRVFDVAASATAAISDLTITAGLATLTSVAPGIRGGGILNAGTLTLTNDVITDNAAQPSNGTASMNAYGGGVFSSGVLKLSGCTVTGNTATGIASTASAFSAYGGGIASIGTRNNSQVTIDSSFLDHNTARGFGTQNADGIAEGGGVYVSDVNPGSVPLTLTNSTVSNNIVNGTGMAAGGAVYGGSVTIDGSTLNGNSLLGLLSRVGIGTNASARSLGGGVYARALTMTNSTVAGNSARAFSAGAANGSLYAFGGGIHISGGGSLTSLTVAGNAAIATMQPGPPGPGITIDASGGGIYAFSPALIGPRIDNSIVAGNTISSRTGSGPDAFGMFFSLGYNLVGIVDRGSNGWNTNDLLGSPDSPIDPLLDPLQDNGGPTFTMELQAGSPALDAGDPNLTGTDQRGVTRSGGINIGSYQASAANFILIGPDAGQVGQPFDFSLTVVDVFGKVAAGYQGTVHFSSSDPLAGLPPDYTFTLVDGGQATFSMVFNTAGQQTLDVDDGTLPTGEIIFQVF